MKYTQEQVLEQTKLYGLGVYIAYVEEAQKYYHSIMEKYIDSVGYMMLLTKTPSQSVLEKAHNFSLAATGLVYPQILCEQIDIYYNQQPKT